MARNRSGMWVGLAVLAALILSPKPAPADPVGRWLTAGSAGVVEIDRCGGALCGRIVGLGLDHPTDPQPTDVHGRPQCSLTIIDGAEQTGPDEWTGHITNPRDGRTYGARIWLDAAGRLHLRGYLGLPLFGQTVVWQPFAGRIADQCRMVG